MKISFSKLLAFICFSFIFIVNAGDLSAQDNKTIIFVCTGNTCRSPMAEGIAKEIVTEKKLPYTIISRATKIDPKEVVANPKSVEVMKKQGIDISTHKSLMINEEDIKNATLILTMTESHKEGLLKLFPNAKDYTFTITEYATGKAGNISDPWGKEIDEYEKTAAQLNTLVPQAIDKFATEENKK